MELGGEMLSGILTQGGTILGTSRKPHRMPVGEKLITVAARADDTKPVPLEDVARKLRFVPPDHPWVATARRVGTCMGD